MFSDPYRGVKHFGIWAEETADQFGCRDALRVLADALSRCRDEDMRTKDVSAALVYLAAGATRQWPFDHFRRALDMVNPETRWQNANAAFHGMKRVLGVDQ